MAKVAAPQSRVAGAAVAVEQQLCTVAAAPVAAAEEHCKEAVAPVVAQAVVVLVVAQAKAEGEH